MIEATSSAIITTTTIIIALLSSELGNAQTVLPSSSCTCSPSSYLTCEKKIWERKALCVEASAQSPSSSRSRGRGGRRAFAAFVKILCTLRANLRILMRDWMDKSTAFNPTSGHISRDRADILRMNSSAFAPASHRGADGCSPPEIKLSESRD